MQTVKCGICWDVFEFNYNSVVTAGFYNCLPGSSWYSLYEDSYEKHPFLCDYCMWKTAAYRKVYGIIECGSSCKKLH